MRIFHPICISILTATTLDRLLMVFQDPPQPPFKAMLQLAPSCPAEMQVCEEIPCQGPSVVPPGHVHEALPALVFPSLAPALPQFL